MKLLKYQQNNYLSYFLSAIAGALAVLSFAPFDHVWVILLSLVVLYALLDKTGDVQSGFWLGWFWGLGLFSFGIFWLRNSLEQFGGLNISIAVFITLLFCLFLALFCGAAAAIIIKLKKQKTAPQWFSFSFVFLGLEWLRGVFLGGFPWLSIGYSQIDTALSGWAPIGGVYLMSLLLLVTAISLFNWNKKSSFIIISFVWGGGYYLQQIDWTTSAGEPFTASLVQGNIEQKLKWKASELYPTMLLYHSLSKAQQASDLIVWPETSLPIFSHRIEEKFLEPLHIEMKQKQQDVLLGIPVKEKEGRYYNSMISLGHSGKSQYYKKHLVPFGEFMPLDKILRPLARMFDIPMSSFSSGKNEQKPINLAGYKAAISICYEDVFGSEVAYNLPEANFLINASNDGWFGDSLAPHQHLQMARMRALETGRYLLRVTNTGISSFIDEKGKMQQVSQQFDKAVLTGVVKPFKGETPYVSLLNWF